MSTKIITEISSCHNGDIELAKALIRAAAENGADIVKFQDWRASNVPLDDPDKARYEQYEFPDEWYPTLIAFCKQHNVEFMTSVFNIDRMQHVAHFGVKKVKIASVSLTNHKLLEAAGTYFDEVIVSTAMHTQEEIQSAIDTLYIYCKKFTIMHCVANYPTEAEDVNLSRIGTLHELVAGLSKASVGYSDHSLDMNVAKMAIGTSIRYLEKHFTLSRYLPQIKHQMYEEGPLITTHEISIEPHELRELSDWRNEFEMVKGTKDIKINEVESRIKARYANRYGV